MNGCAFVLLARWCMPDWRSCRRKQKSYLVTSEAGESWCMQSVCVLRISSSDLVLILFPLLIYTMLVTASELALSASLIHICGIYCLPVFVKPSQFSLSDVISKSTNFSRPFLPPSHLPTKALWFFLRYLCDINHLVTYLLLWYCNFMYCTVSSIWIPKNYSSVLTITCVLMALL